MKPFSRLIVLLAIAMIVSACGAAPAPTVSPVDVQSTAQSAAMTIVAQTLAAMPTATLPPPTETPSPIPSPTNTQLVLPTQEVVALASPTTASSNTGGDPCDTRVLSPKQGRETVIRVANTTKWAVRVSMYLNETPAHGECGYRSFDLSKNNDIVYSDLIQGCYNLWAWSLDSKKSFQVASGTACINNSDKWTFEISESNIKFVGP
jgi:hypothetical protein